jgi:hypothetical protein
MPVGKEQIIHYSVILHCIAYLPDVVVWPGVGVDCSVRKERKYYFCKHLLNEFK